MGEITHGLEYVVYGSIIAAVSAGVFLGWLIFS